MKKYLIGLFILCAMTTITSCKNSLPTGYLILGSYAAASEEGIKVYAFDQESGEFAYLGGTGGVSNPSFVYPSADKRFIYAVGEDVAPDTPTANTLSFDVHSGHIALLGTQPNPGDAPCNIIMSPDQQWVYTSNYFGQSINEFHVGADGLLEAARPIVFSGSSIDPERQTHPYLHAVNFTRDAKFLLADDLGSDRVHIFAAQAPIDTATMTDLATPAGLGPRHLAFTPDGRFAYLLGELSGEIATIEYNPSDNAEPFRIIQTIKADTLNAGGSADIHVSPDGRFVYASHRLKGDGISIYAIDPDSGLITRVGFQPTGIHPRNFMITPNGKFLLAACRDSDCIQLFAIDKKTGLLNDTQKVIEMSKPVCVQYIAAE